MARPSTGAVDAAAQRRTSCAAAMACCRIASIRDSLPTLCWSSVTGRRSADVLAEVACSAASSSGRRGP
jgi:hypothetical protein